MHELQKVFEMVLKGVLEKDPRYVTYYKDYMVVCDKVTGIDYHLYNDKPYELQKGDTILLTGREMNKMEAAILDKMNDYSPELRRSKVYDMYNEMYVEKTDKRMVAKTKNGLYDKEK